jgi:bifunctional DNA-binding transcriptional regulator/antitoxin component of YhaV-PrlF toxin-antitoxin module
VLAKKTSKNQITLPKAIVERFPDVEYFDVREEQGRIVLFPVALNRADAVRDKLAEMGIVREDVADALDWARRK